VKFHVDDYFFDICLHKPDQFGDRDYEQANALEVELINEHIAALLRGESINTPGYDFNLQRRVGGPQVQLGDDDVLVVDSHCGLFPDLTASVPDHLKFKVLLNIYSHIDDIPYTDFNMLRRMFRDSWNRGHEPFKTVRGWHYVRRGVLSDILPFHKTADAHIDGGLVTDLPVMMSYLHEKMHEESQIPTLPGGANPVSLDAYIRFQRVQEYLEKVEQLPVSDWNQLIPESSLIREFIGAA
jgi:uridine kinase